MSERAKRRRYQFSLRTLLIVTAAVATLVLAYIKIKEPYRVQREAMAAITKLGAYCRPEEAKETAWWIRCVEPNPQDVIVVDLSASDKPDECVPHIARLPELQMFVGGHRFADAHLRALRQLKNLVTLDLQGARISDAGLADVALLPTLESLRLTDTGIADDGLKHIAHLPKLEDLSLGYTQVGDVGLEFLVDLPMLERLDMSKTLVTDKGLEQLQRNKSLRRVWLSGARVTDKGIPALQKCAHISYLALDRTGISLEGITSLRNALPECDIRY